MATAWNNGQVMEPGVYVNEPKPKASKRRGSAQSGALSFSMEDLVEALAGHTQGMVSEQPIPKATKEPKETALKMPGLSSELGGLAGALVGARSSRAQRYQQSDPWSIGAEVVNDPGLAEGLGMKLDKPWKQGLMKIAQGLIGGYLGGKARQGLEEYDRPFMQAIKQAGATGDFSGIPISSQDDPTGVLQMSLALSGVEDRKKQQAAFQENLAKNYMMLDGKGGVTLMPGAADAVGALERAKNPTGGASIYPSMQPVSYGQLKAASEMLNVPVDELAQSVSVTGDLDRIIRLKGASGERMRQPNPQELEKLATAEQFMRTLAEMRTLAQGMSDDDPILNVTRTFKENFDTASPEYKYGALRTQAQKEFARARDSGALSNLDTQMFDKLFKGISLLDKKQTILDRIDDIHRRATEGRRIQTDTLEKGGVNVSNFKPSTGGTSGQATESAPAKPKPLPGESWEAFKKRAGL